MPNTSAVKFVEAVEAPVGIALLIAFVAMSGVLLLLCSFALAHAEPNQVKSQPLHCITCAAQEVTCISTAINKCKDRGCQWFQLLASPDIPHL